MSKRILVEGDGFFIGAETQFGVVFLHCEVEDKKKSVLKEVRDCFEVILQEFRDQGGPDVFAWTKNLRFVDFLGVPYITIPVEDVVEHEEELVTWPLAVQS